MDGGGAEGQRKQEQECIHMEICVSHPPEGGWSWGEGKRKQKQQCIHMVIPGLYMFRVRMSEA